MVEKLSEDTVKAKLEDLDQWSEMNGSIQRTFQFPRFVASIAFVQKLAEYAERVQHPPDVLIRYDKVTLTVSTHDAGGITQKDFDLAEESDKLSK